ncbi:MAG: FapA family protein, partial [Oscillospiraceae bacterium]|nr:FapA family protein [Oscillospiraceae bacterium]
MKTRKLLSTMLALILVLCTITGGGFVQIAYADSDGPDGDMPDGSETQPAATAGVTQAQGISPRSGGFVYIDLGNVDTTGASGYTANPTTNVITVKDTASISISGDGTNGGDGWTIRIEDVPGVDVHITIAAGTTILGTVFNAYPALEVPGGASIQGGGPDITITGSGSGSGIFANGDLRINGVIGSITGGYNGISSYGDVTIFANITSITGGNAGIFAIGNVTTSGTLGDISGGNNGIFAIYGDISILGNAGDITGGMHGICAANGGDVGIFGRIGNITAISQ